MTTLLLVSLALVAARTARAEDAPALGLRERTVVDAARGRTIRVHVWYETSRGLPTEAVDDVPVYTALDATRDAPVVGARRAIALLSHGSGGTSLDLAWLVPTLVASGHVVVAVNHPGNTLGDLDDRETLMIWNRPRDLTVVLDDVLADDTLAPHVDAARVVAIGHSLGGYTVLALGGARYDVHRARAHCASAARDPACGLVPDVDRSTIDYGPSSASYRDPRVTRIVALAPAVGAGIDPQSYDDVRVPVLVIAARDDALTVLHAHARRHADALKSPLLVLPSGSHFAFIGPCNVVGRALALVWLDACREPGARSREEIQRKVAHTIRAFVVDAQGGLAVDDDAT